MAQGLGAFLYSGDRWCSINIHLNHIYITLQSRLFSEVSRAVLFSSYLPGILLCGMRAGVTTRLRMPRRHDCFLWGVEGAESALGVGLLLRSEILSLMEGTVRLSWLLQQPLWPELLTCSYMALRGDRVKCSWAWLLEGLVAVWETLMSITGIWLTFLTGECWSWVTSGRAPMVALRRRVKFCRSSSVSEDTGRAGFTLLVGEVHGDWSGVLPGV